MIPFPESGPEFTFPDAESAVIRHAFGAARVILEYGSGGSTMLAAGMPGKLVYSVESDRNWALNLQDHLLASDLPSPATVFHVDIGQTGQWGRPIDKSGWFHYHDYPNAIWDQPYFRHPDVVLIDGRFRVACLLTILMRITRPVEVLFDDYADRRPYHVVEEHLKPRSLIGRMAVFDAVPGLLSTRDISTVYKALAQVTYAGKLTHYSEAAAEAIALRRQEEHLR